MARKTDEEILLLTNALKEMVKTREIFNYTEKDLEIKFNVTRKTVRKHMRIIKDELGNRDMKIITIRLVDFLEEVMNDIEKYWKKAKAEKNEQKTIYYGKQMYDAIDKFIDYLERLGIKQKVADKIEIKEEKVTLSINMDLEQFEQIKELESRRCLNQQ